MLSTHCGRPSLGIRGIISARYLVEEVSVACRLGTEQVTSGCSGGTSSGRLVGLVSKV